MSAVPTSTIAASSRMPVAGIPTRWTATGAAEFSRGSAAATRPAAATETAAAAARHCKQDNHELPTHDPVTSVVL